VQNDFENFVFFDMIIEMEGFMISIAIDGGTACGKGTIAKALADKLGYKVLDTGAIFRGFACAFVEAGLEEMNDEIIDKFVKGLKIEVKFDKELQRVFVNGKDQTANLRTEKTSQMASKISVFPKVRTFMNEVAREFAKNNNCIVEGRDITTVVLPNATVKFFFTADPVVRAKRRVNQLIASGKEANFEDVYKDLLERDERDSKRAVAPLKPAEGAIIMDNSDMTEQESIEFCYNKILEKI